MTNNLDHAGLLAQKRLHPEWIWNRSDSHVFLGVPGSPDAFKTVVEPGNSFSPGFRSYGVSTWVLVQSRLYAPEELDITQLSWRYARGYLPVLECSWAAGPLKVSSALFTDGDVGSRNIRTFLSCSVENCSALHVEATLYIVIRSVGPAGGPISELEFDGRDVIVNGAVVLTFESVPDQSCAIGYEETGKDICVVLRERGVGPQTKASDETGWASGAAGYTFNLSAGDRTTTNLTAFVHAGHPMLNWLHRERGLRAPVGDSASHKKSWAERLPVALDLPDARFVEAFQAQLAYLAMTTVGCEPRISPVSYPLWWLRDGAYVVQALEKGGFGEWVEGAVRAIVGREPFGGFGAEGDGASQLIWLMSEHYLMSGDLQFLKDVYPHVERNAELVLRMRYSDRPIFGATETRTPQMLLSPEADLMCAPSRDGLIVGRMDNHFPLFWVNGWAYFALTRAALCADVLGASSERYRTGATELIAALNQVKSQRFGENDRDFGSAIWPTGWAEPADPVVRERFARFWDSTRCPGGVYTPEPEWTYFEAAQGHNYMFLGDRERAWATIERFLSHHTAQGLYTYHEGVGDENSSLQWQRARGWDHIRYVTPHGWTSAELFLLLRDALLRETATGALVIGEGVPRDWMTHNFSARGLPSHFGSVNLEYEAGRRRLTVLTEREPADIVISLPGEVDIVRPK